MANEAIYLDKIEEKNYSGSGIYKVESGTNPYRFSKASMSNPIIVNNFMNNKATLGLNYFLIRKDLTPEYQSRTYGQTITAYNVARDIAAADVVTVFFDNVNYYNMSSPLLYLVKKIKENWETAYTVLGSTSNGNYIVNHQLGSENGEIVMYFNLLIKRNTTVSPFSLSISSSFTLEVFFDAPEESINKECIISTDKGVTFTSASATTAPAIAIAVASNGTNPYTASVNTNISYDVPESLYTKCEIFCSMGSGTDDSFLGFLKEVVYANIDTEYIDGFGWIFSNMYSGK